MWLALLALFTVVAPVGATVVVNEVMASNGGAVADEDGDFSDWLEVFNTGPAGVALGGWSLSDQESGEARWMFPDGVTIGAGARLVVWASGKDKRVAGAALHTNFSISADGEMITLLGPDGEVADVVPPVAMTRDFSYGRSPDGAAVWRFFEGGSPGGANGTSGVEALLQAPVFSHEAGFYADAFSLVVSSADAGVALRYTLDGSVPTEASALYVGPIGVVDRTPEPEVLARIDTGEGFMPPTTRIAKGTTVRVRAYRDNALASEVATATFFVGPQLVNRYDKPVVSITVDADEFFGAERGIYVRGNDENWEKSGVEWERLVHVELFETDGKRVISQDAGARIHGGASRDFATKTLRLYARDEYGGDSHFEHQVFPDAPYTRYKRLLLRPGGNDAGRAIIHDGYNQTLVSHMRFETLAYRPAVVFINGEYWGLKNLRERYDKHYVARVFEVDPDNIDFLTHRNGAEEGDNLHYRAMITYVEQNDLAQPAHYAEVQRRMDTENFMDYQIAEIFLNNTDWPGNNIDFWRLRVPYSPDAPYGHDGRWRWMLFDTDFGFGLYYSSVHGDRHNEYHNTLAFATATNGPNWPNPPWSTLLLRSLLRNADFRSEFINRFADQLNTAFQPRRCLALLDELWPQTWTGWNPEEQPGSITNNRFEHTMRWPGLYPSWGPYSGWSGIRSYSLNRAGAVFGHLQSHFGLGSKVEMTFDCNGGGKLGINTIVIDEDTLGIADPEQPYPWKGAYFSGVPITVTAYPVPGYRFERWLELPGELSPTVVIDPGSETKLTALFTEYPFYAVIDPHVLSAGDYAFSNWAADAWAGTYPAHTVVEQSTWEDPALQTELDGVWLLPYNLSSRSRAVGLGADGIGFINTGNAQEEPGAGYLGSLRLGLNTAGREQVLVSWTVGTATPGQRQYGMRLQYRAGGSMPWQDMVDTEGAPYAYLSDGTAGHSHDFGPVRLPEALENMPYVELRWKYYHVSGGSGNRPLLRLDNIRVTSQPTQRAVALAATHALPDTAETGAVLPSFSIRAVNSTGETDEAFDGEVRVRADGVATLEGTVTRMAVNGVATFEGLILRGAETVALVATSDGLPTLVVKLIEVQPASGLAYTSWRNAVYTNPADRANENISGPYAIGVGGWTNLVRYAFEMVPADVSTLQLPHIVADGAGSFLLRVPYPGNRTGVGYIAEQLDENLAVEAVLFDSRTDTVPESAAIEGAIFILVDAPESATPTYFRVRLVPL